MSTVESAGPDREKGGRSAFVAPSNRINVALPFSKIQTQEPSHELAELAAIVAELTRAVKRLAPNAEADAINDRAQALAYRLR